MWSWRLAHIYFSFFRSTFEFGHWGVDWEVGILWELVGWFFELDWDIGWIDGSWDELMGAWKDGDDLGDEDSILLYSTR
jgi:hypothetical protein